MSINSSSTIRTFEAESMPFGQTGDLRTLDMLLHPASPISEIWDTDTQDSHTSHGNKNTQDEIAKSPGNAAEAQPALAPRDIQESDSASSFSDGKENRHPGFVFKVIVSDGCHRVEAEGSMDSAQAEGVEMEFSLPLQKPLKIRINLSQCFPRGSSQRTKRRERRNHDEIAADANAGLRAPERRWRTAERGHGRLRVHNFRRSKRMAVEVLSARRTRQILL